MLMASEFDSKNIDYVTLVEKVFLFFFFFFESGDRATLKLGTLNGVNHGKAEF